MKKTKMNQKIIILFGLFVFILFISFYFNKEGVTNYIEHIKKGPRYLTSAPSTPPYDYGSYNFPNSATAAQNITNCKEKCTEKSDCKGVIVANKCYLSKTINQQTVLKDNLVINGSNVNTYIKS